MTMMDPMIEEEEKSCSPIITAHPLITKRHDRHRNRNRNRRSSITHLRTYCESLSASIAPDNEMGLQTMGLRLSNDNRAKLQAAIEDTTVWIEEQDNNAVTNIDDSDYVELSDDVLEAKERDLVHRASEALLKSRDDHHGREEEEEEMMMIAEPAHHDVVPQDCSDCKTTSSSLSMQPVYLSPADEGCPPFECPENRFPTSHYLTANNGSSSTSCSCANTNANTPPEEWGMSVNQLNNFVNWCKSHPRWDWIKSQYLKNGSRRCVSGYDMSEFFVKPWTTARNTGAGVALCMNPDEPKRVNLFLSHAWAEDVEELVQSVNRHCRARKLDKDATIVWCCIFALYQNDDETNNAGPTIAQQVQMKPPPFEAGIASSAKANGVLLCHTQHENVCDRLWCVFEIFKATSSPEDHGYSAALHIGCSDAYSLRLLAIWKLGHHHIWLPRCRNAKCTVEEDRYYITEQVECVKDGWMKVDSTVYSARMQLAKLGCHLEDRARLNELDLIKFEREFSNRHVNTMKAGCNWVKVKAAARMMPCNRKRKSVWGVTTKLRGYGMIFPTEEDPRPNVWGHQNKEYKRSISPYVEDGKETDLVGSNHDFSQLVFSYERIRRKGRVLPQDLAQHLWSSRSYQRSGTSTAMPSPTVTQLFQMSFGIKQHGKFYLQGERYFDGDYYDYQIEQQQGGGGRGSSPIPPEEYPVPDIPGGRSYHSGIIHNCTGKRGRGMKVHEYGVNACIDAVVTRFDHNGNLQMMTMVRPEDALDDAGEFQLTSGCLFFGTEHGFETRMKDAHGNIVDDSSAVVKQVNGPVPFRLVSGATVDCTGKIQNKALVYARAAIVEKHFYNKHRKADVHGSIGRWNFYKLASGMVDDVCNTDEAWVETSIVVHHITGYEGTDELSLFETSAPPPGRKNAGLGIWRSIDSAPKEVHTSQYAFVDEVTGTTQHRDIPVKQPFDPYAEFDLWYGDHAFMASMVGDFVKMHYSYEGPAELGFGKSQCIKPHYLDMTENDSVLAHTVGTEDMVFSG